jgi:hypothetical protein
MNEITDIGRILAETGSDDIFIIFVRSGENYEWQYGSCLEGKEQYRVEISKRFAALEY